MPMMETMELRYARFICGMENNFRETMNAKELRKNHDKRLAYIAQRQVKILSLLDTMIKDMNTLKFAIQKRTEFSDEFSICIENWKETIRDIK